MTVKEASKTVEGYLPNCDTKKFVLDILERAEKKKPNVLNVDSKIYKFYVYKFYDLECPNCGAGNFYLMYDDNVGGHFDFCAHCGQALDWSDI